MLKPSLLAILLVLPLPALRADDAKTAIPPEIAEIIRKAQSGQQPTPEEMQKIEDFARLQSRGAPPDGQKGSGRARGAGSRAPADAGNANENFERESCHCIDLGAIRRRLEEAQVAIAAYRSVLPSVPAAEPFTKESYGLVRPQIQTALDTHTYEYPPAGKPNVHAYGGTGPGITGGPFCSTELSPTANACERESLDRHEAVHRRRCEIVRNSTLAAPIAGLPDRAVFMTLRWILEEEVEAYGAEESFLKGEIARLDGKCFVWSGTITYAMTYRREESRTDPVATADGTKTTQTTLESRRAATVRLANTRSGGEAEAEIEFRLSSSVVSNGSGTVRCRAKDGNRNTFVDRTVTWDSRSATSGEKVQAVRAKVRVSLSSNGKYEIGFRTPSVPVALRTEHRASRSGGCEESKPVEESGATQGDTGSIEMAASGSTATGKPEPTLSGSKTETTGTIETTTTWNIKRSLRRE